MTRQELRENLPDFVRKKLSPKETREIEVALQNDLELKNEVESLKRYFGNLDKLPRQRAPRDFLASVKTKIETEKQNAGRQRRLWFVMSSIGSAMALSIGLLVFFVGPFSQKRDQSAPILAEASPKETLGRADKSDLVPAPKRFTAPPAISGGSSEGPIFLLAMNDIPRNDISREENELAASLPSSGKSRPNAGLANADRSASRKRSSETSSALESKKESPTSKDDSVADTAPEGNSMRPGASWNERELTRLIQASGGLILTNAPTNGASGKKWVVQISRAQSEKLFKALEPHRLAAAESLAKSESEEKGKLKQDGMDADEKAKSPPNVFQIQFVFVD